MWVEFDIQLAINLLYCRLINNVSLKACPVVTGIMIEPFGICYGHVMRIGVEVVGQKVVSVLVTCVVSNAHKPLLHVATKLVCSLAGKYVIL